jgi:hypothetical protein
MTDTQTFTLDIDEAANHTAEAHRNTAREIPFEGLPGYEVVVVRCKCGWHRESQHRPGTFEGDTTPYLEPWQEHVRDAVEEADPRREKWLALVTKPYITSTDRNVRWLENTLDMPLTEFTSRSRLTTLRTHAELIREDMDRLLGYLADVEQHDELPPGTGFIDEGPDYKISPDLVDRNPRL